MKDLKQPNHLLAHGSWYGIRLWYIFMVYLAYHSKHHGVLTRYESINDHSSWKSNHAVERSQLTPPNESAQKGTLIGLGTILLGLRFVDCSNHFSHRWVVLCLFIGILPTRHRSSHHLPSKFVLQQWLVTSGNDFKWLRLMMVATWWSNHDWW